MAFDWSHYLDLANELKDRNAGDAYDEARLRSAISRAYYAAHNLARAYYQQRFNERPRQHLGLVEDLKSKGGDHRTIGNQLYGLRKRRAEADYDDVVGNPHKQAAFATLEAKKILETLVHLAAS